MVKPRKIPAFDAAKYLVSDPDEIPLTFGKYRGETPLAVASKDPGYLLWIAETFEPKDIPFTSAIYELCKLTHADTKRETEDEPSLKELDGHLNFHK